MPRGGARPGSGPKGKSRPFEVLDGGALEAGAVSMPDGMSPEQQACWKLYAPLATERRTLTPSTVPAFQLLCELKVEMQAVKETLDRDGRTYIKCVVDGAGNEHQELKAHPLKPDYSKLAKQVETLMGRFLLAPFGKPLTIAQPKSKAEKDKAASRTAFFGVANRG